MFYIRYLFFIGFFWLSGCGFHLRGAGEWHFSLAYIHSESANTVAQEVKRLLTEAGVQIVPTPQAAQVIVSLRHETVDRRILTVSAVSGKLEEVELNFWVEMEVRKPNDKILLKKQTISLLRDYSFDETAVLAMDTEEEVLREEMFRDIVAQIMRRLQTLKLGQLELSQLAFEGLKTKYAVGEPLVVDLVETSHNRTTPVDIWMTLTLDEAFWFITPSNDNNQPWQLSSTPQPWQRHVAVTQSRHHVLDFTTPPNVGGKYILRAIYTVAGHTLDLNHMAPSLRSNVLEGKFILENQ